jgi:hypothetical protein
MKKVNCFAAVIGMGLAMTSWAALAQEPAVRQDPAATTVVTAATPAIPADQQPTPEQLVKMFKLMRVEDQLESITKAMPAIMQQQMAAQMKQIQQDHPEIAAMNEEHQQALAKVTTKYLGRVMNLITSDEMIADMTRIYQKHFTRSDVDGIIIFYSSPAGQHLLDKQPVILQEYLPLVMQRTMDRIKPLTDEMTREMAEIAKSSIRPADKPTQK